MGASSCNTDLIQVTEGADGAAGVAGPQINILSIEGVFTFDSSGVVSRTYSYVINKGNIWRADPPNDFTYVEHSLVGQVTLTNFLKVTNSSDKFNVHIELKKILKEGILVFNPYFPISINMDILHVGNDEIRFRFIDKTGKGIFWKKIFSSYSMIQIDFSLLILGLDDF